MLVRKAGVGDQGERLAGGAERLGVPGAAAEQLDAVRGAALVALGDDDVEAAVVAGDDLGERQLAVEPGDEGEALGRGDHVGLGAGLAVAPGVLAGMVDLERVRVVLDGADAQAQLDQLGHELLDQGRLARVALADDGDEGGLARLRAALPLPGHAVQRSEEPRAGKPGLTPRRPRPRPP